MQFFREQATKSSSRKYEQVVQELDILIDKDWASKKPAIALLILELVSDYRLLRHFIRSTCANDDWPILQGAQSYLVHKSKSCVIRINLWFPKSMGSKTPDTFRRYLSIEEMHNHDFDFFTACVLGPGYSTQFFRDRSWTAKAQAGDLLDLDDNGLHVLAGGDVLFVERHLDYHLQHWPSDFAVTLNVIPQEEASVDRVQYIVDSDTHRIRFVAMS